MDEGQIVEQNDLNFFNNPKSDRTKLFLTKYLTTKNF